MKIITKDEQGNIVVKNTSNRKWIIWLVLVVIGIILFATLFRGCEKSPSHKDGKKEVDSVVAVMHENDQKLSTKNDSIAARNAVLEKEKQELLAVKAKVEKQLDRSITKAAGLLNDLKDAKVRKDTQQYVSNTDSLTGVVENLIGLVQHYETNFEETVEVYEAQLRGKDSIIANKELLLAQFRSSLNTVNGNYQSLMKDYTVNRKKLKRERTWSRILAGIGILAGGAAILK